MNENLPVKTVESPVAPFEYGAALKLLASLCEKYSSDPEVQVYLQLEYFEAKERELLLSDGGKGLQRRLCHHLILADQMIIKLLQRALGDQDIVEATRRTKEAARLMSVYQQGVLALNKVRAGNEQRITVQHINVSGGNALVATNVRTGGAVTPVGVGEEN